MACIAIRDPFVDAPVRRSRNRAFSAARSVRRCGRRNAQVAPHKLPHTARQTRSRTCFCRYRTSRLSRRGSRREDIGRAQCAFIGTSVDQGVALSADARGDCQCPVAQRGCGSQSMESHAAQQSNHIQDAPDDGVSPWEDRHYSQASKLGRPYAGGPRTSGVTRRDFVHNARKAASPFQAEVTANASCCSDAARQYIAFHERRFYPVTSLWLLSGIAIHCTPVVS